MSRRWPAVLLVLVVCVAAAIAGFVNAGRHPAAAALRPLQLSAALDPCPPALSPALPRLTLPCLGGGPAVPVAAAAPGQPEVVTVWAHWCVPCVQEVPLLTRLRTAAAGRLALVGVLTEDDQATALRFAHDFGIHYPSVVDNDGVVLRAFLPGPPVTLFITPDGRVAGRHSGSIGSWPQLARLVRQYLGLAV